MNTNPGRETAKILTFPAGGRAGVAARREQHLSAANMSVRPLPSHRHLRQLVS